MAIVPAGTDTVDSVANWEERPTQQRSNLGEEEWLSYGSPHLKPTARGLLRTLGKRICGVSVHT